MGLALSVGILAELTEDEEGYNYYLKTFEAVNKALTNNNLPTYNEPAHLNEESCSFDMYGYSGLHYLRRIAAYLWAGKPIPSPGKDNPEKDPLLEKYYSSLGEDTGEVIKPGEMKRFDHLLFHSDCEGFYVPIKFGEVIFTKKELKIPGEMIGSSYMLLEECKALAQYLELPLDIDPESDEVWDAADNQGQGDTKWKRYGIESFTCLRLYYAAKKSIELNAAVVFT